MQIENQARTDDSETMPYDIPMAVYLWCAYLLTIVPYALVISRLGIDVPPFLLSIGASLGIESPAAAASLVIGSLSVIEGLFVSAAIHYFCPGVPRVSILAPLCSFAILICFYLLTGLHKYGLFMGTNG